MRFWIKTQDMKGLKVVDKFPLPEWILHKCPEGEIILKILAGDMFLLQSKLDPKCIYIWAASDSSEVLD